MEQSANASSALALVLGRLFGLASPENARYLLSAEAQVLAAILALSITGVLVVAQMTASMHGSRAAKVLLKQVRWATMIDYALTTSASLVFLAVVPESDWNLVFSFSLGAVTLSGLLCLSKVLPFVRELSNALSPEFLVDRITNNARETDSHDPKGRSTVEDCFTTLLEMGMASIDRYDYAMVKGSLKALADVCIHAMLFTSDSSEKAPSVDWMLANITDVVRRYDDKKGPKDFYPVLSDRLMQIAFAWEEKVGPNRAVLHAMCELYGIEPASSSLKQCLFRSLFGVMLGSGRPAGDSEALLRSRCRAALYVAVLRRDWSHLPMVKAAQHDVYPVYAEYKERLEESAVETLREFERLLFAAGLFYQERRGKHARSGISPWAEPTEEEVRKFAGEFQAMTKAHPWGKIESGCGEEIRACIARPGSNLPKFVRGWAGRCLRAIDENLHSFLVAALDGEHSEFVLNFVFWGVYASLPKGDPALVFKLLHRIKGWVEANPYSTAALQEIVGPDWDMVEHPDDPAKLAEWQERNPPVDSSRS